MSFADSQGIMNKCHICDEEFYNLELHFLTNHSEENFDDLETIPSENIGKIRSIRPQNFLCNGNLTISNDLDLTDLTEINSVIENKHEPVDSKIKVENPEIFTNENAKPMKPAEVIFCEVTHVTKNTK